jgi:hypothetical protein
MMNLFVDLGISNVVGLLGASLAKEMGWHEESFLLLEYSVDLENADA